MSDDRGTPDSVHEAEMRWDNLFDDLESQLEHELGAEDVDLLAEEERLRLGRLALRDRIRGMSGAGSGPLRFELRDATALGVEIETLGRDWLAGAPVGGRSVTCIVPLTAVASILPTPDQLARSLDAAPLSGPGTVSARIGLPFVLRDLCRRRAEVEVVTRTATRHGTIDRVGRDHLDLAEHAAGEPRRASAVTGIRVVPFGEMLVVRF